MDLPESVHIIGMGGREHALAWLFRREAPDIRITAAPGNTAWLNIGVESYPEIQATDFAGQINLVEKNNSKLTVVGPERPLIDGVVDLFQSKGRIIYGPNRAAARIEASKAWFAKLCAEFNVPTAASITVTSVDEAIAYVKGRDPATYVIKADGDALGKGVFLPQTEEEAVKIITDLMVNKTLQEAGRTIVFQKRLHGQEFSLMLVSDGWIVRGAPLIQDHKRIGENDTGENTGGMGTIGPIKEIDLDHAMRIGRHIVRCMTNKGIPFVGTLFMGCILTEQGVKVLEVNCRWGDPETETLAMLCHSGMLMSMYAAAQGKLLNNRDHDLLWHPSRYAATAVLAAEGYPGPPRKGDIIRGLDSEFWEAQPNCRVFHMGTRYDGNNFFTNGGRVLAVSAWGYSYGEALDWIYRGAAEIHFEGMQIRRDIGQNLLTALQQGRIGAYQLNPAQSA